MHIKINEDYNVVVNTALLGYVGETNARPVSVEGMEIDGADRYVLTIDYGDGVTYEVDITGGQWTPTADILRSAQTVSCQIAAKKLSGDEYILVKKSRIFRLRIGAAIGDNAVPSPSVAADALDRISAIGEQVEADVERAENAASTAMQAAENAKKSATAAEKSADTATQAASRAETAKASAETSATQADTARQGAETARQQAVAAQNNAKISAAQASVSAQQTEADKNITAGYAKTAKTNADSTAADRQAVQTLAEQVTSDKATVAENATKVAEDRTAAETAAQTAQSIADSLPEDYVTAVGKIAENTAEIGRVKMSDKELKRRVDALYSIGQGITHRFETDSETAYQKTVPTGGKLMSVKNIGGRSIVFNQNFQSRKEINNGITATVDSDGTITLNGTVTASYFNFRDVTPEQNKVGKYAFKLLIMNNPDDISMKFGFLNRSQSTPAITSGSAVLIYNQTQYETSLGKSTGISGLTAGTVFNNVKIKIQIFDLTLMFGAGNEPTSVEEFEAMFPNDYYQYNAGEIVSAGTESIIEQGKNLFDYTDKTYNGANISKVENGVIYTKGLTTTVLNIPTVVGSKYTLSFKVKSSGANQGGLRWSLQKGKNTSYAHDSSLIKSEVGYVANTEYQAVATFVATTDFVSLCTIMPMVYDVQLENGDTATGYSPFYQTEYPIPEAIKALLGYGWSAGTAKNYVDYENKRYVQCVGSVDLGTLSWRVGDSVSFETFQLKGQKLTKNYDIAPNILCSKYPTKTQNELWGKTNVTGITTNANVDGCVHVNDTSYTDATAFKQAMQDVMLYYELATPIVTDISDLLTDDFLRNIEVEAGGSVTFKNSNDNYHIPVPSEEEYIVKLSEVGGTT
ncbi:hypothetical protein [Ruminococcus sp.]|uniref:hypothetical protein n=1 Tax=Ruminococcus sp. TaxID=41978 RepID=UPI0026721B27|nr:hypothetical protein [uncultured Ruminococcus sp.]